MGGNGRKQETVQCARSTLVMWVTPVALRVGIMQRVDHRTELLTTIEWLPVHVPVVAAAIAPLAAAGPTNEVIPIACAVEHRAVGTRVLR